ncbi:hypothetical protein PHISCL_04050 [Aspergillus sclerotialis]|uniref:Uncharacterized protein n=1 Tax=Aspergillus sclerotialis TaxID=2070753 RepID=A0A3A2ZWA9_9EURO|nr:hypothetical protein PHISCL_04050 [Aspergillus sclerotialis]
MASWEEQPGRLVASRPSFRSCLTAATKSSTTKGGEAVMSKATKDCLPKMVPEFINSFVDLWFAAASGDAVLEVLPSLILQITSGVSPNSEKFAFGDYVGTINLP